MRRSALPRRPQWRSGSPPERVRAAPPPSRERLPRSAEPRALEPCARELWLRLDALLPPSGREEPRLPYEPGGGEEGRLRAPSELPADGTIRGDGCWIAGPEDEGGSGRRTPSTTRRTGGTLRCGALCGGAMRRAPGLS